MKNHNLKRRRRGIYEPAPVQSDRAFSGSPIKGDAFLQLELGKKRNKRPITLARTSIERKP